MDTFRPKPGCSSLAENEPQQRHPCVWLWVTLDLSSKGAGLASPAWLFLMMGKSQLMIQ